jgi:hypothetical protein
MAVSAQKCKYVAAIPPAAILDNTSATAVTIDTLDYDYLEVIVTLGATDVAMTALKLQDSASDFSGADVTGADFDGGLSPFGDTLALPSATDDDQVAIFQVELDGSHERYFQVVATFGDGTAGGFVSAVARLSRGAVAPTTNTGIANGGVCRV